MILIIGASGQIGLRVSAALADRDDIRVLAHSDASAEKLSALGIKDVKRGDLMDPQTLPPVFEGVEKVFLLTHGTGTPEQEINAIEAAEAAGAKRVVKLSTEAVTLAEEAGVTGPPSDGGPDSRDMVLVMHQNAEIRLRQSKMEAVILRPTWFMSVHTLVMVAPDFAANTLVWPAQGTPMAFIHPDDVADAAVACLLADAPLGDVLHLTGPELITFDDLADRWAKATGRPIVHRDVPYDEYIQHLIDREILPPEHAVAITEIIKPFSQRSVVPVTGDVQRLTGKPPRTLDEYLQSEVAQAVAGA